MLSIRYFSGAVGEERGTVCNLVPYFAKAGANP